SRRSRTDAHPPPLPASRGSWPGPPGTRPAVTEHVDVVVVGMGPGGEVVADRLLDAGRRVAVAERELIGGECAYWACVPSKTVLRSAELLGDSRRVPGVEGTTLSWPQVRDHRDEIARHLDDRAQIERYEQRGALVVKG